MANPAPHMRIVTEDLEERLKRLRLNEETGEEAAETLDDFGDDGSDGDFRPEEDNESDDAPVSATRGRSGSTGSKGSKGKTAPSSTGSKGKGNKLVTPKALKFMARAHAVDAEDAEKSEARRLAGAENYYRAACAKTAVALQRAQLAFATARTAVEGTVFKVPSWLDKLWAGKDGVVEPEDATMALVAAQGNAALMQAFANFFAAQAALMEMRERLIARMDDLEAAIADRKAYIEARARAAAAQELAEEAAANTYHGVLLSGAIAGDGAVGGAGAAPGRARAGSLGARARSPSRR